VGGGEAMTVGSGIRFDNFCRGEISMIRALAQTLKDSKDINGAVKAFENYANELEEFINEIKSRKAKESK
jgi:hypothetical protein